jgi:hypothetical protein
MGWFAIAAIFGFLIYHLAGDSRRYWLVAGLLVVGTILTWDLVGADTCYMWLTKARALPSWRFTVQTCSAEDWIGLEAVM